MSIGWCCSRSCPCRARYFGAAMRATTRSTAQRAVNWPSAPCLPAAQYISLTHGLPGKNARHPTLSLDYRGARPHTDSAAHFVPSVPCHERSLAVSISDISLLQMLIKQLQVTDDSFLVQTIDCAHRHRNTHCDRQRTSDTFIWCTYCRCQLQISYFIIKFIQCEYNTTIASINKAVVWNVWNGGCLSIH